MITCGSQTTAILQGARSHCRRSRHRGPMRLSGPRAAPCLLVVVVRRKKSVADVVDSDHDEQGFATGGTLRRLEHAAASAGVDTSQLWRSVDDVLLREMATEQKNFQRNAAAAEHRLQHRGPQNSKTSQQFISQLSRWATLFTADVGFAADGRAYLYETLLQPSWKGPGFQWTEAADREKLGIYSSLMLAMAPMMLHPAADEHTSAVPPISTSEVGSPSGR